MTSGPQDKDDLLRRRIEFFGLKPEESEECKKVKQGKWMLITGDYKVSAF